MRIPSNDYSNVFHNLLCQFIRVLFSHGFLPIEGEEGRWERFGHHQWAVAECDQVYMVYLRMFKDDNTVQYETFVDLSETEERDWEKIIQLYAEDQIAGVDRSSS
jgi:hypothetical protein